MRDVARLKHATGAGHHDLEASFDYIDRLGLILVPVRGQRPARRQMVHDQAEGARRVAGLEMHIDAQCPWRP
jgi:hypothetical protein